MELGSLDACVQATLSALYPPFGGSAGPLLGQVLAVVERAYAGDGLRYLLDFLLPARHILHCVQLHACGQYPGRLFAHAGWPLCLGEYIVVHLGALDWCLLEPGDFYLQLVPFLRRQPRLVVTCLAPGGHSAQQLPVPEASYSAIFTTPWLDTLNSSRLPGTGVLRSCLLVAPGGSILRVPWEQVLRPCFLDEPGTEGPPRAFMASLGPSDSALLGLSTSPGSHSNVGRDSLENAKLSGISQCPPECEENPGTPDSQPAPDTHKSPERSMIEEHLSEDSLDTHVPQAHATDWRYAVCSYEDAWIEEGTELIPEEKALIPPVPHLETLLAEEQQELPDIPPRSKESSSPSEPPGTSDLQQLDLKSPATNLEDGQSQEEVATVTQAEGAGLSGDESPQTPGPTWDEGQGCVPEHQGGLLGSGARSPAHSEQEDDKERKESRDTEKDADLESPYPANLMGIEGAENPLSLGELERYPAPKGTSPALPVPRMPILAKDLSPQLLASGIATLPGTRDSEGRAVLLVFARNPAWLRPHCSVQELADLFLYLHSIPRPEVQALGLTVLVDARHCLPSSNIFLGLSQMQKVVPGSVHQVLLLGKMSGILPSGLQLELLPSYQALLSFIPNSQLPIALEGCLLYSHNAWLDFRKRLEALQQSCLEACALLQRAIENVEAALEPDGPGGAGELLQDPRQLMQQVLEDPQLAQLQREGGIELAQLQWEDPGVVQSPDYRWAVAEVGKLYAQVDVLLHQLVTLCNKQMQVLELRKMLKAQAQALTEIQAWLQNVGWPGLKGPEEPSLDMLLQSQDAFWEIDHAGQEHLSHSKEILSGWDKTVLDQLGTPGAHLISLQNQLSAFSQALTQRRQQLTDAQHLSLLLDQALAWTQDGQKVLTTLAEKESASPEMVLHLLEGHRASHPDLIPSHFQEMRELAAGLGSSLITQQCHLVWAQYQDTQLALDKKLEAALRAQQVLPALTKGLQGPPGSGSRGGSSSDQTSLVSGKKTEDRAKSSCSLGHAPSHPLRRAHTFDPSAKHSLRGSGCHFSPREPSALPLPSSQSSPGSFTCGVGAVSSQPEKSPIQRPLGLQQELPDDPILEASNQNRLNLVLGEMVATEREYVRALDYVVENYFPELERVDVPQGLRGQRVRLFGNLEKLRDFHRHFFLRELESCSHHPLRVARAFLRHREQFGMYALYSKNKPRSDALLASHGNAFFKGKQHQLGDHLDLASYLLKPIQRMSKYALLLQELSRTCEEGPGPGWAREPDLAALHAACDLVRFQLRHGNDLLAMDAIHGCDVNLKEQGQLVRQDEFTVWSGRKKCQRHIFLFEELILFSKSRHGPRGINCFVYKRSFKTADIGLTENSGESGLRFEIWFRRRKASDTFVLQAHSAETKQAWTADIASLLWRQAARNKEIRMAEMVSMGVGNKPFLDITPSEAAINDRAINYIMKDRGSRTRASIAVSLFDHTSAYPGPAASLLTGPSSCSLLGPLNLHLCGDPARLGLHWPLHPTAYLEEELYPETEMGSQPSLTPESSEASSQCPSASSSGSDSGCVAGLNLASGYEDQLTPALENKPHGGQSQYVSLV